MGDAYLSKKLRKNQSIQYIFLAERQKHLHHPFSPPLVFPLLLVMCVGTTQDNLNLSIIGPHVKWMLLLLPQNYIYTLPWQLDWPHPSHHHLLPSSVRILPHFPNCPSPPLNKIPKKEKEKEKKNKHTQKSFSLLSHRVINTLRQMVPKKSQKVQSQMRAHLGQHNLSQQFQSCSEI